MSDESFVDDHDGHPSHVEPPDTIIICVDCGGTAHLITTAREDNQWYVGDVVAYRCGDCRDRWDIILE
ncbi:MAG: hypothetical protein FJW13_07005 [Actinobacteria bacterium]|nr:hypothetical protein [Actinomycetota bacterium]